MKKNLRTYSLLVALLTTTAFTPITLFAAGAPAGGAVLIEKSMVQFMMSYDSKLPVGR